MSNSKKILVITYYWPPSGGAGVQRWVKFCKYLPEFNIEPIVLTVKDGTYPLVDKTLSNQIPKDLKVFTSTILEPYSIFGKLTGKSRQEVSTPSTAFTTENESLIKKIGVLIRANFFIPDARRGWVPFAVRKAQKLINQYDIDTIVTTAPPNSTHLIGSKLKEKNPDIKWIMDMRDPWTKIFFNQSIPRTSIASRIDEKLELKALTLADEVIVVSNSMAKLQKSVLHRKYHIIPNGFDHSDFPITKSKTENRRYTIKYIGSMTEAAIPYTFLKALKSLEPNFRNKIELQFFGSINNQVAKIINDLGLTDNVSFHGYVPHLQAKKEMQTADLLLLIIPNTKDNELILTGKIFDYIGAQRPILLIGPNPGDAADIVNDYKLGVCFNYDDDFKIIDFLKNEIYGDESSYKIWDEEFKNHPFSRYSLTVKLTSMINTLKSN